ncbi:MULTISPECIES: nuclear transport factor 2 family protein [unclassified Novosphingobium]|uniref:nuclear transport factor 2 family protein n=1 Tax=unclassified Novosphingobium TaxID=2644732 RepID=UPI00086D9D57|nr:MULTISPECIES: nuclear transport factor 2 family protein [unclassified Novosphingobium]MBN9146282.1 nuclear transport factor 2 family protein [Novosphingobium sp.]MDR6707158.1 uncharacterized protein (TIGR02246 family) [Novosphingobium sp. 1748]ODU79283.1 MAG: hypothetical protein ABT10_20805 [Novosphingobium sp. SCN 63-17]OJX93075.1 MAG: hypothetical protein BGP00_24685 [Novosphingobium sp. 63-713]
MTCPPSERFAIADLVTAYALAVDRIGDADGVAALFAPDGVYDLSALGMGEITGREGVRGFFVDAFAGMAQNAHFISNLSVLAYDPAGSAQIQAYGHAFSLGKDGNLLEVKARYAFDLVRRGDGWLIARLGMAMLLPPVVTPQG